MNTYEQTLSALSDGSRRAIIENLRLAPRTVSELTNNLPISQPAVSQHLKILSEARLVTHSQSGTSRTYSVNTEGLSELRKYIESFWDTVLEAFAESGDGSKEIKEETS